MAHYSRQQSLVVDRLVDNLALEAATSYGGTRQPAVAHALKKQLHKVAQKLPSLAAASSVPVVSEPEVVVVRTAVMEADGAAADGVVMREAVAVAVVAAADAGASAEPLLAPIEVGCASDTDLQSYDTFLSFASLSCFLLHAMSNDQNQVRMLAPTCMCLLKLLPCRLEHTLWQTAESTHSLIHAVTFPYTCSHIPLYMQSHSLIHAVTFPYTCSHIPLYMQSHSLIHAVTHPVCDPHIL